jgi:hypothetical protein
LVRKSHFDALVMVAAIIADIGSVSLGKPR